MQDTEPQHPFEGLSFQQIMALSPHEFSRRMEDAQVSAFDALQDVGDPHYGRFTAEQKVEFWRTVLHRQLRIQVESGLDPYAIFNPQWYAAIKKLEPDLDSLIDQVFASPQFSEWSKGEYLRRIHG